MDKPLYPLKSGLSDDTRIVIDEKLVGHQLMAIHTKCMLVAIPMKRSTVRYARTLCKTCFGDVVKSHRKFDIRRLFFF